MGYSGAGGKLIDEKNQKQKISWHCPFKEISYKAYLRTNEPWISVFILLSASQGQSLLNIIKTKIKV